MWQVNSLFLRKKTELPQTEHETMTETDADALIDAEALETLEIGEPEAAAQLTENTANADSSDNAEGFENSGSSGIGKISPEKKKTQRKKGVDFYMYLAAFFVPVIIALTAYAVSEVWPFGEECFLKTDMYHQYAPFFSEFRYKLLHGGSLFYTWDVGMGVNFLAVYAYYLASPLNWLVILAPENHVIEFMMILMIVKLGLASVSFTCYLRKHAGKKDAGLAFFGIFYALSGYMCAYYWNMMWLDCIILFPIIIYGLEKLIKEGRMFLYAAALGVCIFSNYYISIMICIFLVIWFFALNILEEPQDLRQFLVRAAKFAAASLIAGAFAAVLLLPAYNALKLSASASSKFPSKATEYFSFLKMLYRLLPTVDTEQVLAHWPNIYSGTAALILFPLYIMTRKIEVKEKAVYICTAVFFLASFSLNFFDYIWHGLHFPNSLPCRQSFIFVFLMLFMCFRAYSVKAAFTRKDIGTALTAALIFIVLAQQDYDTKYYHIYTFYIAGVLAALYAFTLRSYSVRKTASAAAFMMALFVVTADVAANAGVTSFTTCSRTYYVNDNEDIRKLTAEAEEINEGDFFRYKKMSRKTKDDGAWLNFRSVSLFSSTADAGLTKLFTRFGCEASTNAYSITGSTPLVDMLLSVKYGFYGEDLQNGYGKEFTDSYGTTRLYENRYSLPVGFILPEKLTETWVYEFDNPILVQNSVCDVAGTPQVLKEIGIEGSETDKQLSVTIPEDGEYYVYVSNTAVKNVTVSWQGKKKKFDNVDRKYFVELGECSEGELVKFSTETDNQKMNLRICRFDYDALSALYDVLSSGDFHTKSFNDRSITGTIKADSGSVLCFSIPYDEGWKAYIDGAEAETFEGFGEALLSVNVPEGEHEIKLAYTPLGFKEGLLLSICAAVSLCLIFFLERKKRGTHKSSPESSV